MRLKRIFADLHDTIISLNFFDKALRTEEDLSNFGRYHYRPTSLVSASEYANWMIRLRWIAILVAFVLVLINVFYLHYLEFHLFPALLICLGILLASNFAYIYFNSRRWFENYCISIQIIIDLIILTALLHFSGGIENPLAFIYIFHVMLSGIIHSRIQCFWIVVLTTILFAGLAIGEMSGFLHHYTLEAFPHTTYEHEGGQEVFHVAKDKAYVASRIGMHFVLMSLTGMLTTSIIDRLRLAVFLSREARDRLNHFIQATGLGLLIINRDNEIECLNQHSDIWKPILTQGYDLTDWILKNENAIKGTLSDGNIRIEERPLSADDESLRYYEIVFAPFLNEESEIERLAVFVRDITEKKMIEAEINHAGKMALVGQMASGISHEVGNPLASISARLSLMEDCQDPSMIKESISVLRGQIARINRIVQSISQVSRPSRGDYETFNIFDAIQETLDVLNLHQKSKKSKITYSPSRNPLFIRGIKDQIIQVMLNLGLNAFYSMPQGGELTISATRKDERVIIIVSDTGKGIAKENLKKIFDFFYTTKNTGLGIGLSLVAQIVDAHGGQLEVESQLGVGTRFLIDLPLGITVKKQKD